MVILVLTNDQARRVAELARAQAGVWAFALDAPEVPPEARAALWPLFGGGDAELAQLVEGELARAETREADVQRAEPPPAGAN